MPTLSEVRSQKDNQLQRDLIISRSKFVQKNGVQIYATSDLKTARTNLLKHNMFAAADRIASVLQKIEDDKHSDQSSPSKKLRGVRRK